MNDLILIIIGLFILSATAIVVILNIIQSHKNKKYKKIIDNLEIEKNMIDSSPIIPELAKIEGYLKNEKLEVMYNDWKERLEMIKGKQVPKITDMLIEADYSLSQMDYKSTLYKIAKLEMEIYKVRTTSEFLLSEIKEITSSEERNRAIITNLKADYRKQYQKFNESRTEYGEIENYISLQFENIAKRFEMFETAMENNEYTEVTGIIKSIDELLKHISIVVEEVPPIVLIATNILPKRIDEIMSIYNKMIKEEYPLDYLNVDYNISEANNKITDIMDRLKVLNLEDSLFELKILIEYFDSLFTDFEKEKINKETYEETSRNLKTRLENINILVNDIFTQMEDIKNLYNLSTDDIKILSDVKNELANLNKDYKILVNHTSNHTFAYSKLIKEIEGLVLRLNNLQERLDNSLEAIGSMKEDEVRARQQLDEIKFILKESKSKLRDYNLPLIPKTYYIELNEASSAIREIVTELAKKPITITVLNTRVDTARDLVLKLYTKTKEMLKTAMFAEMAIIYGNRYRVIDNELDKNLNCSEILFYKGEYKKSLELTINSLNKIDSSIYQKLLNLYGNES